MRLTNLVVHYTKNEAPTEPAVPVHQLLAQLIPSGFRAGPPEPDKLLSEHEANEAVGGNLPSLVAAGFVVLTSTGVRLSSRGVAHLARTLAHAALNRSSVRAAGRTTSGDAVMSNVPAPGARLLPARTVRTWYHAGGPTHTPLATQHKRYRSPPQRASVATAVLLDCSHSMILYGEDRFTPAKHMALAFAGLVRRDFPTDELHFITFHNSATVVHENELAMQRIGPWYTNTAAGLTLARQVLRRSRSRGKRIVLITDGKPSMITLESGNTYQNSYGIDPQIRAATLHAAAACRHDGIAFTSVMIANDPLLRAFMADLNRLTRGTLHELAPHELLNVLLMWRDERVAFANEA